MSHKLDMHQAQKECAKEEIGQWFRVITEANGVLDEVKSQQTRYHALGY
jgi:hypothetical protein